MLLSALPGMYKENIKQSKGEHKELKKGRGRREEKWREEGRTRRKGSLTLCHIKKLTQN